MVIRQINQPPRLLTIAGSDSGGGAGVQADLKTFSALGCYGMSVITALTAQNTKTVSGIFEVSADFVEAQLAAIFDDIGVDAIKIGMLHRVDLIETVTRVLKKYQPRIVVVDPVMMAKSGDKLLRQDAIQTLRALIFPLATVITPNIPEAEILLGRSLTSDICMDAEEILGGKKGAIVFKGGHAVDHGDCVDTLVMFKEADVIVDAFGAPRILTKNTHGTGCTFSSAIAAYLAHGYNLSDAVRLAKDYLWMAIERSKQWSLGQGHGPVDHMHLMR